MSDAAELMKPSARGKKQSPARQPAPPTIDRINITFATILATLKTVKMFDNVLVIRLPPYQDELDTV